MKMKKITQILEQIGSQSLLQKKVVANGFSVLNQLGANKALSLALLKNDKHQITVLTKITMARCCYIQVPSIIANVVSIAKKRVG